MKTNHERRLNPRVAVNYTVFYQSSLAHRPKTKLLDLSVEGAGLEALDPLPIGAETSFVFVTPEFQPVACRARVTSLRPLPDAKYRVGVRFLTLSAQARQVVTQAVQTESS